MILRSIEFKEKFLTKRDKDTILKLKFDPNVQYITGPNGYGKTTIFNLIYQMILKDDIDQDLKDCVGAIKLETSQGDITFDHINGSLVILYNLHSWVTDTPQKPDFLCVCNSDPFDHVHLL